MIEDKAISDIFKKYDSNRNSYLELRENMVIFQDLGIKNVKYQIVEAVLQLLQEPNQQYDGYCSLPQFVHLCYTLQAADIGDSYQLLFYAFDIKRQNLVELPQFSKMVANLGFQVEEPLLRQFVMQFSINCKLDFPNFQNAVNYLAENFK